MRKFFSISVFSFVLSTVVMSSCNGRGENHRTGDSIVSDTVAAVVGPDYCSIRFETENEVRDFLHFKRFADKDGYISFTREGGVIDGEPFAITSVSLNGEKEAVIGISITKMKMEGKLLLKITDEGVVIKDDGRELKLQK